MAAGHGRVNEYRAASSSDKRRRVVIDYCWIATRPHSLAEMMTGVRSSPSTQSRNVACRDAGNINAEIATRLSALRRANCTNVNTVPYDVADAAMLGCREANVVR